MRHMVALVTALAVTSVANAQDLPARIGGNITTAQRAAAVATLKQIRDILLQIPELRQPNGFEIYFDGYGGSKKLGPDEKPVPGGTSEYMLRAWIFHPVRRGNEGCVCITIKVNDQEVMSGGGPIHDAEGREVIVESRRGAPVPFAVQTWNGLSPDRDMKSSVKVALVTRGELPWRQVTREEFYAAALIVREGRDGAKAREMQEGLEKTPYERWMEGVEERRVNREQSIAIAGAQSPEYGAKMRKQLEDVEREVTASLKASHESDVENNKRAREFHASASANIRAELEAMTPEERRLPVYVTGSYPGSARSATGWSVQDADNPEEPQVRRVFTPIYDFWRARRSPVEVRSITVLIEAAGTGQIAVVNHALKEAYRKLDWAALNALLYEPR